jgi:glucose-6-phosphate 1-dehydrogenase
MCLSSALPKSGWNLDRLKARAKDSLEKHGGIDPAAFEKLSALLRYVDGDYKPSVKLSDICREDVASVRN